jgi:hypothetical protein
MAKRDESDEDGTRAGAANPVGYVEHDSRGQAVWRWTREGIDSTTILLKRLDNDALALEPTQKVPVASVPQRRAASLGAKRTVRGPELTLEGSGGRDAGGGFDPYNSSR